MIAAILAAALAAAGAETPMRDLRSDTWTAVDGLGRRLPGHTECGPPKPNRTVGIFYFLWLGSHSRGVHDITRILADPARPWGPPGAFHFWGEPRFGYYRSDDAWVIRRHAQMLTDAGVDVLFMDVTNAVTYDNVYLRLCEVFEQVRAEGRTTPQIAFLANSRAGDTVQHLYDAFYQPGLHRDLWFEWKGRPLLLANPAELTDELRAFFELRQSWAWSNPNGWFGDGRDKWCWVDNHPQQPGWHESPDRPEQISVAVAQHPVSNIGRSFHAGHQPAPGDVQTDRGLCFDEQFARAIEVDPELVFITGWNEWVAQRFIKQAGEGPAAIAGEPLQPGDSMFIDQYTREFSRDIEPMRGGHGDNYYYQMVAWIRRYKGVRPLPVPSAPKTIRIAGGFEQWDGVEPVYLDDVHDTDHRDEDGFPDGPHYVNRSGRNDFVSAQVARDAEFVYFRAACREPITPPEGANWMTLLIDTDGNADSGWNGFDLAVGRLRGEGSATIEQSSGGWRWTRVGQAEMRFAGGDLHLAVPRRLLGHRPLAFDFQWTDNLPENPDAADLLDQGDCAPNGRFRYRYQEPAAG